MRILLFWLARIPWKIHLKHSIERRGVPWKQVNQKSLSTQKRNAQLNPIDSSFQQIGHKINSIIRDKWFGPTSSAHLFMLLMRSLRRVISDLEKVSTAFLLKSCTINEGKTQKIVTLLWDDIRNFPIKSPASRNSSDILQFRSFQGQRWGICKN